MPIPMAHLPYWSPFSLNQIPDDLHACLVGHHQVSPLLCPLEELDIYLTCTGTPILKDSL